MITKSYTPKTVAKVFAIMSREGGCRVAGFWAGEGGSG
jgi:hypothetical protein